MRDSAAGIKRRGGGARTVAVVYDPSLKLLGGRYGLALAGPTRLRDYDVPREDLKTLSDAIAERAPAKANPRPAPPDAIRELLEEIW